MTSTHKLFLISSLFFLYPPTSAPAQTTSDSTFLSSLSWQVIVLLGGIFIFIALLLLIAAFRDGRRLLVKLFCLVRNMLGVEVGLRGVTQLIFYSALPAVALAFIQGNRDSAKSGFDWHTFWLVLLVVTSLSVIANLINSSMTFKRVLSPGAGRMWRAQRKSVTAAIIHRLNKLITQGTASSEEMRTIIRDLLDVIVLHVRDHRGSIREDRPEVFANLLLEDGVDLVVVARDRFAHSGQYQRQTPARYSKAALLCGRAMESRKALSVGVLTEAYPEGPKNKPYQSILAIPLFTAEGDAPYGALSIDCSRRYFFESFTPGQAENDLENSLQPYVNLITLALEALVKKPKAVLVQELVRMPPALPPPGG